MKRHYKLGGGKQERRGTNTGNKSKDELENKIRGLYLTLLFLEYVRVEFSPCGMNEQNTHKWPELQ